MPFQALYEHIPWLYVRSENKLCALYGNIIKQYIVPNNVIISIIVMDFILYLPLWRPIVKISQHLWPVILSLTGNIRRGIAGSVPHIRFPLLLCSFPCSVLFQPGIQARLFLNGRNMYPHCDRHTKDSVLPFLNIQIITL